MTVHATFRSLCAGLGKSVDVCVRPMAARQVALATLLVCRPRQRVDIYVCYMAACQIVMFKLFCSLSLVLAEAGSIVPLLWLLFFVFGTKQDWTLLAFQVLIFACVIERKQTLACVCAISANL
jgi:hypothetical protein